MGAASVRRTPLRHKFCRALKLSGRGRCQPHIAFPGNAVLKRLICCALLLACGSAAAQSKWVEGRDYFRLDPAQPTSTPGKIEVLEVFSYACPACNAFEPTFAKLRKSLPPQAQVAYLPASFNPQEDWPVFQRAFLAARLLGVAEKSHDAMYDAVWKERSLATVDSTGQHLLQRQPTIEDVAKFYLRYGVKESDFVAMARSFTVETQMRNADADILGRQVDVTPTVIVNGKYRVKAGAVTFPQMADIVLYLVDKEKSGR
jgi:thiol:disulfide interchange protein DsbA